MAKSAEAFRTISEVAEWLGVQTHVLRFWESKFTQIKPVKRAGGRRYYRPADMLLLGGIRKLLYEDGLTIKGVQKILREQGMAHVADMSGPLDDETSAQIDGDLVSESGFVDAELASSTASDETVTPFAPVQSSPAQDHQPTAPISYKLRDPEPEPEIAEEQAPEPAPVEQQPEPDRLVADEAAPPPKDQAPAPVSAEPAEPESAGPAADPAFSPLPSFLTETAPEAGPVPESAPQAPPQAPKDVVEPGDAVAARHDVGTSAQTAPLPPSEPPDEAAPAAAHPPPPAPADIVDDVPAPPRPRIVDVPADPDPSTIEVSPSVLTRLAGVRRLTPQQRSALRPLVAQLTALRDHMASVRRDPQ